MRSERLCPAAGLLISALLSASCGAPPSRPAGALTLPPAPAAGPAAAAAGWTLTVYYTLVEPYHGPPLQAIRDCGGRSLGERSAEFLSRIQTEGFGRLSTPVAGDDYLGWDFDRGCWSLATNPVGADDRPLRPWISLAAPADIALGTGVRIAGCGTGVGDRVCARVRAAAWVADDRCGGGCPGRHLDLYIGEEDRPDFETASPAYFEAAGARITLLN